MKEIVDSFIYDKDNSAPNGQAYVNDETASEETHLLDIGDVKKNIYRASKKNFMDSRKTDYGYKNYNNVRRYVSNLFTLLSL